MSTSEMIEATVRERVPRSQAQIVRLLRTIHGVNVTQQAVSYHLRRLGALRDVDGFWYLP